MSVSPTENALIVALDFEGGLKCVTPLLWLNII